MVSSLVMLNLGYLLDVPVGGACREFGKKASDLNVVIVSEEMTFKAQRL